MDAVVAFIANGEGTKPVEPGERALDDQRKHAKAAAVGRAATAEDRNNAAGGGQVRDQGVEVGDVVDVRGRDMRHQRTPRASVTMWCLDPALRRAVGFGPVFSPAHRADRPAVHHRPALVEPSPSAQLGEEGLMQATPDDGPFPLHQASPERAA